MAKKLKLSAFKEPIPNVPGVLLDLGGGADREPHTFTAEVDGDASDEDIGAVVREAIQVCAEGKTLVLTEQPTLEQDDEKGAAIQVAMRYYLLSEAESAPAAAEPYKGYEE